MDEDYLARFPSEDVARHLRLSAALSDERPAGVEIVRRSGRGLDIVVVAFDYFAELSILCGQLAASGLDVVSADIYTFSPGSGRRASPRKIVDVFHAVAPEHGFEPEALAAGLVDIVRRLAARGEEARDLVTRRLAERLERLRP
jgi:UTP:GlnB (protein PII) uridylyltransferase